MRNLNFRFFLSALALFSIMMAATAAKAAPVQFNQVVQMVNAKPGKANTGGFAQLRLAGDDPVLNIGNDDPKTDTPPVQDDRVITETRSEIVEDDVCDCEPLPIGGAFPYWTLGFAAVPLLFLIPPGRGGGEPTPTPTTPTPTTPTPTPTATPPTTPTPPMTPTPPTEPVPEPMTILLFGTGLASIGLAARRKFGKRDEDASEEE